MIHNSNEAEIYDAKHEKTTLEIVRRVQARRDFIGVDWIEDDSDDDDDDGEDDGEEQQRSMGASKGPSRSVRVLDYACGTGAMSRVCTCCFDLDQQICAQGRKGL